MADQDAMAIIHVINLYGLAMDTQRWDLFDRIFTHDVEADFGDPSHWRNLATLNPTSRLSTVRSTVRNTRCPTIW
jgi:SnoaL-like domain